MLYQLLQKSRKAFFHNTMFNKALLCLIYPSCTRQHSCCTTMSKSSGWFLDIGIHPHLSPVLNWDVKNTKKRKCNRLYFRITKTQQPSNSLCFKILRQYSRMKYRMVSSKLDHTTYNSDNKLCSISCCKSPAKLSFITLCSTKPYCALFIHLAQDNILCCTTMPESSGRFLGIGIHPHLSLVLDWDVKHQKEKV